VKEYASGGRLDIVDDETFALSATDFTAILTKLKSTDAQAIWLWNLPQAVAVTKQYSQLGIAKQLVLTGGNATPQYLSPSAACPEANGALINSPVAQVAKFLPKSNPSRAIALHVDSIMGQRGNQFFYDGYSAVNIIKAGLLKANMTADRQKLIAAFESGVKYVGAEGPWIFKGLKHAGLGVNDLVISKIVNCAYKPVAGSGAADGKIEVGGQPPSSRVAESVGSRRESNSAARSASPGTGFDAGRHRRAASPSAGSSPRWKNRMTTVMDQAEHADREHLRRLQRHSRRACRGSTARAAAA